jgi:plasmid stabilization system protein ParE
MGAAVVVTSRAWQDLREIIDYIAKDNPAAARQLSERLLESALSLGQAPLLGCRVRGFPSVRMMVCRRYLIIYKVDPAQKKAACLALLAFRPRSEKARAEIGYRPDSILV